MTRTEYWTLNFAKTHMHLNIVVFVEFLQLLRETVAPWVHICNGIVLKLLFHYIVWHIISVLNRSGVRLPEVEGHRNIGHLVRGKFRDEKGHFMYVWPKSGGGVAHVPPVSPRFCHLWSWLLLNNLYCVFSVPKSHEILMFVYKKTSNNSVTPQTSKLQLAHVQNYFGSMWKYESVFM